MTRLAHHGAGEHLGQQGEEGAHRAALERERRRQLHQHDGEALAQSGDLVEEGAQRRARAAQARVVRDGTRQLGRKAEVRRRLGGPRS
jgi:hypothetical protein